MILVCYYTATYVVIVATTRVCGPTFKPNTKANMSQVAISAGPSLVESTYEFNLHGNYNCTSIYSLFSPPSHPSAVKTEPNVPEIEQVFINNEGSHEDHSTAETMKRRPPGRNRASMELGDDCIDSDNGSEASADTSLRADAEQRDEEDAQFSSDYDAESVESINQYIADEHMKSRNQTVFEFFKETDEVYLKQDPAKCYRLRLMIHGLRFSNPLKELFCKFQQLVNEIAAHGEPVNLGEQLFMLFHIMPQEYQDTIDRFFLRDNLSLKAAMSDLSSRENELKEKDENKEEVLLEVRDGMLEVGDGGQRERGAWRCLYDGCRQVFQYKSKLERHQYKHRPRAERPIGCPFPGCSHRSLDRADDRKHQATVHGLVYLRVKKSNYFCTHRPLFHLQTELQKSHQTRSGS